MKPDKLTIHDVFQKERRYVVPLYQRAYVWQQDEQWEPLWEDIERQAEACLKAEGHVPRRSHFLGAIVLNVSKIVGAGVARSEIIDGQQRLTTLQLFVAALRDFAVAAESQHAAKLKRLTVNEDEKEGSEQSFKVWPTNADRVLFRQAMTAGSPDNLRKALQLGAAAEAPRIASAYLYFHDRVTAFCTESKPGEGETQDDRIFGLLQALRTALQLVVIELEQEDDPQVIFETLNARGQPLLPSDLVRNYLFLRAANEPSSDTDELYAEYWKPFDDKRIGASQNGESRFWHVLERQGRLTRPRIDLFLFHYLSMRTERELNIGQLFREFRDWFEESDLTIKLLLADLKAYSHVFELLLEPTGKGRDARFSSRIRALDTSTVFPLLLYVLSLPQERLPTVQRDQILADLESWLVRRLVCQLTNKNYNRFFLSLLSKLKKSEGDVDLAEVVRGELSRSGDPTLRWPANAEFSEAWLSKPIYVKSRPDRAAMLLAALEVQLRTSKNEAVGLPEKLTVEHLLPQKGTLTDYPHSPELLVASNETPELARERIKHTIGNLTLLTGELNSAVSNGAWPGKVKQIVADSDLRLNAWLRSDPPAVWNEESARKRGEDLFSAAVQIWEPPLSEPENVDEDESATGDATKSWQFTDSNLLRAKRKAVIASFSIRQEVLFARKTEAVYQGNDNKTRAIATVSKRYPTASYAYWYAYHPKWDTLLSEAAHGFLLLGCMDKEVAFAIPHHAVASVRDDLNTTTTAKKTYWHLHLTERDEGIALILPKKGKLIFLNDYAFPLLTPTSP